MGVQSNDPLPLPLSVKEAPDGSKFVVSTGIVPSGSEAVTPKLRFTFSVVALAPIAARTGASFTKFTVIATTSLSTAVESSVA